MESGKLDRLIVIQRYAETRDALNGVVQSWTDAGSDWASVLDVSDAEQIAAQQVGADITTRLQMRWNSLTSTITAKDRLCYRGLIYQVIGVKALAGRDDGIEISTIAKSDG